MDLHQIVDGTTPPPGDLDVDVSVAYDSAGVGGTIDPANTLDPITVDESEGVAFTVVVENNDAVGPLNDDACDGVSGAIEFRVTGNIPGVGILEETACIDGNGGAANFTFNYNDISEATNTNLPADADTALELFVEGANTGTRVTPLYILPLNVVADISDPGGGTSPGGLNVVVDNCGPRRSSAAPGDRVVFEAEITNLSDVAVDVPVTLLVNGEPPFGERVEPNIEPGETRTFLSDPALPEEGTYNYELDVGPPSPA